MGIVQARILEWVAYPFLGDFPDPGIILGSPELQADFLSAELPLSYVVTKMTISGIYLCKVRRDLATEQQQQQSL